jgi:hypothetical protein
MTEQARAEMAARNDAAHPSAGHQGHNTTPGAWVTVVIVLVGFIVGGIGLIEWNWIMFWIGVAVAVAGVALGAAVGIMAQVTEYGDGGRGGDPGSTVPGNS